MVELEFHRTLSEVALEPVLRVDPAITVAESADLLVRGYGALILTEPLLAVTTDDIVGAVASGVPVNTPVSARQLKRPLRVSQTMRTEAAMRALLDHPGDCLVVVDQAAQPLGRLTLHAAMRSLLSRPPWVHALQIALEPHEMALIEIETEMR